MIFNKKDKQRKKNRVRKSTFKFAELCSMLDFIESKPRLESQNNFWLVCELSRPPFSSINSPVFNQVKFIFFRNSLLIVEL